MASSSTNCSDGSTSSTSSTNDAPSVLLDLPNVIWSLIGTYLTPREVLRIARYRNGIYVGKPHQNIQMRNGRRKIGKFVNLAYKLLVRYDGKEDDLIITLFTYYPVKRINYKYTIEYRSWSPTVFFFISKSMKYIKIDYLEVRNINTVSNVQYLENIVVQSRYDGKWDMKIYNVPFYQKLIVKRIAEKRRLNNVFYDVVRYLLTREWFESKKFVKRLMESCDIMPTSCEGDEWSTVKIKGVKKTVVYDDELSRILNDYHTGQLTSCFA